MSPESGALKINRTNGLSGSEFYFLGTRSYCDGSDNWISPYTQGVTHPLGGHTGSFVPAVFDVSQLLDLGSHGL